MSGAGGSMRLGDAEREAAVAALEAHRIAGRLDPTEYEDRTVKASAARVWADLDPLFADLPEPRPRPAWVAPHAASPVGRAGPLPDGSGLDRWGQAVVALTPFLALALFLLVVRSWVVFLLIPVVAVLVRTLRDRDV